MTEPVRRRLPDERQAITHKFQVAQHTVYLTVGLFENGQPGELFICTAKEGSTISGLLSTVAILTSIALQYGVPLAALCTKFSYVNFEPSGWTTNPDIKFASSIVDYVFRWLELKFIPGKRALHTVSLGGLASVNLKPPGAPVRLFTEEDRAPGTWGMAQVVGDRMSDAIRNEHSATSVVDADNLLKGSLITPGSGVVSILTRPDESRPNLAPLPWAQATDAPPCTDCGSLMVRSGACYKCMNCGGTSGCS